MTKIIKATALDVIRSVQAECVDGRREMNLADLALELQSRIIFNVLVGRDFGDR